MNDNNFYALQISFHPDPQVESKKQFSTQEEAQNHIDTTGKSGEHWMIVKETNKTYEPIKAFRYHK